MIIEQRIFSILKPDVYRRGLVGKIITHIEDNKFRILGIKKHNFSKADINNLYIAHKDKFFFNQLAQYLMEGPVILLALEKANGIEDFRKLIGATNPEDADEGTIRKLYGISIDSNSIHGSDSIDSGKNEIEMFFSTEELLINF